MVDMRKVRRAARYILVTGSGNPARQRCDLSDDAVFQCLRRLCRLCRQHDGGQTQGQGEGLDFLAYLGSLLSFKMADISALQNCIFLGRL